MSPLSAFSRVALVTALAVASPLASATIIQEAPTGLANPGVIITFDEHVLTENASVTNQYQDLGVTFTPMLYYTPYDDEGPYTGIDGPHYLGDYMNSEDGPGGFPDVPVLTIAFASLQQRAAFGFASNHSNFTFSAFNGTNLVETFDAIVGDGYFGFTDITFDRIVITTLDGPIPVLAKNTAGFAADQVAPEVSGFPDFYLLDNLQFDPAINLAAVPEPEIAALFGLGLFGAAVTRRRRSRCVRGSFDAE